MEKQRKEEELTFHSLNSSSSTYQSISLKPDFFDVSTISGGAQIQCNILLKAICSVLRTSIESIDHLRVHLPSPDASKVQWTLDCINGFEKAMFRRMNEKKNRAKQS